MARQEGYLVRPEGYLVALGHHLVLNHDELPFNANQHVRYAKVHPVLNPLDIAPQQAGPNSSRK
jgi:hypothetical protein